MVLYFGNVVVTGVFLTLFNSFFNSYQYRNAATTHIVDNGADIRHVQSFLGHADISTTQAYVHVSMIKLREVYDKTHPSANRT
jgi:integrase/recombinase XerD